MAKINEIAPDVYRLSVYVKEADLQFNHFLIRDEQPLLYHTGYKAFFPELREAVASLLDPAKIRWIGFSHFESDECGALNHWLETAPEAQPVCGIVGARVMVNDFALRSAREMPDGEILPTGQRRFRYCATAHLPHGWDAGLLFEETAKTLFCSDLFFHTGDVESLTELDVVGRAHAALRAMQPTPFANSIPYTNDTEKILNQLATLQPATLATMHGSSFRGDGARAIQDLAVALRDTFGRP